MPKLKEFRQDYYYFSGKVSDNVRSLCLSAVAVIWVFKQEAGGVTTLPTALYWALLWVICALAADFMQYLYASLIWGIFSRYKENKGIDQDAELLAPAILNWPTNLFYLFKILFAIAVYIQIFRYLFEVIKPS
ncbi:hypothetical protein [Pseudomonas syringae]|uniref:hypothetical protein n=1 Tax=Pseudomonas syringae TaxID=317 RepID=UPI002009DC21|nr:hypothetical protein [Pseudomonas syringae]MCK9691874.1 hypothetical protein [Pseudomonas syringae pv. syringae]